MKFLIAVACCIAAIQVSSADQDVKAALDQLEKAFNDMKEFSDSMTQKIDTKEIKDTMVTKFNEMQTQMSEVNKNVEQYLKDHPESPVAQAAAKMQEVLKDFKEKNPDVESNLKNFQHAASEAGEKFTQQMKDVYEKMGAEGGLKDQLSQIMFNFGESMKKTASDIESKIKEMVEKH